MSHTPASRTIVPIITGIAFFGAFQARSEQPAVAPGATSVVTVPAGAGESLRLIIHVAPPKGDCARKAPAPTKCPPATTRNCSYHGVFLPTHAIYPSDNHYKYVDGAYGVGPEINRGCNDPSVSKLSVLQAAQEAEAGIARLAAARAAREAELKACEAVSARIASISAPASREVVKSPAQGAAQRGSPTEVAIMKKLDELAAKIEKLESMLNAANK
jgi:hypothetical protein